MLNIQPETLSRVLNRLKRNKIIESVNGKINILNLVALEKIYREFI
jgi:CRP/FNR family transcriptional regulator